MRPNLGTNTATLRQRLGTQLTLSDDGLGYQRISCQSANDTIDSLATVRVVKGTRLKVVTPGAEECLIFMAETDEDWIFSISERLLGEALGPESIDHSRALVRSCLGQAPLVPTVLKGAQVLVPHCEYLFSADSQRVTNLIQPLKGSSSDLLDELVDLYRQELKECESIGVLCSSGWDSRLEAACIAKVAREQGSRVRILHLCGSPETRSIVDAIAAQIGAEVLIVDDLAEAQKSFGRFTQDKNPKSLQSRLMNYSTWRPSIPVYQALVSLVANDDVEVVFGFTPYELRGRQYDVPIQATPAESGRLRLIVPAVINAEFADLENDARAHQETVWKLVGSLCEGWEPEARIDYMLWVLNMGFSYSHRVNQIVWPTIRPVTCHNDVVSRFFGLGIEEKRGIRFVDWALSVLDPKLAAIPVISSSGEKNRSSHKPHRFLPVNTSSVDYGRIFLERERDESISDDGVNVLKNVMEGQRDQVAARQILEFRKHLSTSGQLSGSLQSPDKGL